MITITCPSCGKSVEIATPAATLASCDGCKRSFVPEGARAARLLTRSRSGECTPAAEIPLSDEFLRRYRLECLLGSGAMGTVYRAVQLATSRLVAVKFMLEVRSRSRLVRFVREARLQARISHPNVVKAYDIGDLRGHPYFVVEYLPGGTLGQLLERSGHLELPEATRIACSCLSGLDACHEAGVIHRDLKPENILFDDRAEPKIADLGIARPEDALESLTRTGAMIGTPRYMSPEQLRGETADARSDLYAVGLILYEMLSGHLPFHGLGTADRLRRRLDTDPPRLETVVPGLPGGLADVVHRALARNRQDRPRSAADLRAQLSGWDTAAPRAASLTHAVAAVAAVVEARPPRPRPRIGPAHVACLAALASGLLLCCGLAGLWTRRPAVDTAVNVTPTVTRVAPSSGPAAKATGPVGITTITVAHDKAHVWLSRRTTEELVLTVEAPEHRFARTVRTPSDCQDWLIAGLESSARYSVRPATGAPIAVGLRTLAATSDGRTAILDRSSSIEDLALCQGDDTLVCGYLRGSGEIVLRESRDSGLTWADSEVVSVPGWRVDRVSFAETGTGTQVLVVGQRSTAPPDGPHTVLGFRDRRSGRWEWSVAGRAHLQSALLKVPDGRDLLFASASSQGEVTLTRFSPGAKVLPRSLPLCKVPPSVTKLALFQVDGRLGMLSQSGRADATVHDTTWSIQDRPGELPLPFPRPIALAGDSGWSTSARPVMYRGMLVLAFGGTRGLQLFASKDRGRTFEPLPGPPLVAKGQTPALGVRGDELFLSSLAWLGFETRFLVWSTRDGREWNLRKQIELPPALEFAARGMCQVLVGDRLTAVASDQNLGLFLLTYP